MPESYIPSKDSSALEWMQAFRDGIAQNPSLYMLSEADSQAISEAVDDFQAKMAHIVQGGTALDRRERSMDVATFCCPFRAGALAL